MNGAADPPLRSGIRLFPAALAALALPDNKRMKRRRFRCRAEAKRKPVREKLVAYPPPRYMLAKISLSQKIPIYAKLTAAVK